MVEILSPTTARPDCILKYHLYLAAGVAEYWIIDPMRREVSVNVLRNGVYHEQVYTDNDDVPVSVLEGCTINARTVFPTEEWISIFEGSLRNLQEKLSPGNSKEAVTGKGACLPYCCVPRCCLA